MSVAVELPHEHKAPVLRSATEPGAVRLELGDGSFGGWYERPDEDVLRLWRTGVEETREAIASL